MHRKIRQEYDLNVTRDQVYNAMTDLDPEGLEARGDLKTLTPGPWTPLRTRSMDYLTDRSTDPFYGPPLRTTPKNRRNAEFCKIVDSDEVHVC